MTSLLHRYVHGEHEEVWDEIYDLDYEAFQQEIDEVAAVTMRRVQANVATVAERLRDEGFAFHHPDDARRPPPADVEERLRRIDSRLQGIVVDGFTARPLPSSVRAFYRIVGSVDLTGHSRTWPANPEPSRPELAGQRFLGDGLYVARLDWLEEAVAEIPEGSASLAFSPDLFHKEDISGGPAYAWDIVSPSADAFCTQIETAFVPYLRFSLSWGGFPGLRLYRNAPHAWVANLIEDLEPF